MKKIIWIAGLIITGINSYSQIIKVPMNYQLQLADSTRINNNYGAIRNDKIRENFTVCSNKFSAIELQNLYRIFSTHLKSKKEIQSLQTFRFDSPILAGLFKGELNDYTNPDKYEKAGEWYISKEYSKITWKDTMAIHEDKQCFFTDNNAYSRLDDGPYNNITSQILGLGCLELWSFDKLTGVFNKQSLYSSLLFNLFDPFTEKTKPQHLISLKTNSVPEEKNLLKSDIRYDVLFDQWTMCTPYTGLNKCDEIYGLNLVGLAQGPYISPSARAEIILGIFGAIEKDALIAYDPIEFDKGIKKVWNTEMVYNSMLFTDTVSRETLFPPYEIYDTVITSGIQATEIIGISFVEDWYFDPTNFNFYKKVNYYSLLVNKYNRNTGELQGYYPLFFVKPKD